jgi:enamine deaminase RidA (YjgF/YER057c/UK114 family)
MSTVYRVRCGVKTDGYHARSALGFVSLPGGVAVEIEALFEIKD